MPRMRTSTPVALLVLMSLAAITRAAEPEFDDGKFPPPKPPALKWNDLLSGRLEDHWTDMNCTLAGSFKLAPDAAGVPVLAGNGHPIGVVRSMRAYENFVLELDWRHLTEAPNSRGGAGTTGNSGLYVWADPIPPPGNPFTRAVEVQICNLGNGQWYTSHGDLFPIHGATMTADPRFGVSGSRSMPVEFRGRKTGEWNHCRITCADGAIQQELNGALVTAGFRASPRKGYLCIESEGGPVEFKNMRLAELPGDPGLAPEQICLLLPAGTRTTCLYDGISVDGWTAGDGQRGEWAAKDHVLACAGRATGDLSRMLPSGDCTVILDWAGDAADKGDSVPFALDGLENATPLRYDPAPPKGWNRAEVKIVAGKVGVTINGKIVSPERPLPAGAAAPRALRLLNPGRPISFCNLMRIDAPTASPRGK